ncbi:MAG TPA: iron-sulfur cluster assembly accessory protein [Chloroflexota bacterium]|nr:iron-sulfur cluster assembly accessory protein [Chloroflexota bacterium]
MVTLTPLAVEQMTDLLREQNDEELKIRLFVQAARGNEVAYGMGFDNEVADDDLVFQVEGISFVVDPDSLPFVEGSEIDFVDALMGRGFTMTNPNYQPMSSGCGCGSDSCGCGHHH